MPNDTFNPVMAKGYDAAAAITKYRAVKFSADQTVTPVTAITDKVAGIAVDGVTATEITKGKGCPVISNGRVPFEADAACAAGQQLAVSASVNGTLTPLGTAGAGTIVVGLCVLGAAAQGARGTVELTPGA
jgi:hypothetical protein